MSNGDWCYLLLRAAEFIDRNDQAFRRGPHSTQTTSHHNHARRQNSSSVASKLRALHNELEKTRRANLKRCFDRLKELVPIGSNSGRHTTLGVLNRSTILIKSLQQAERQQRMEMEELERVRSFLLERLTQLTNGHYRQRVDSSPITTNSVSSNDQDEIDVECTDVSIQGSSDCDENQSNTGSDSDAWQIP